MPTTHRMRLLNVGAVLTAVLSLGAIIGTAACEPDAATATGATAGHAPLRRLASLTVGLILPSGETSSAS